MIVRILRLLSFPQNMEKHHPKTSSFLLKDILQAWKTTGDHLKHQDSQLSWCLYRCWLWCHCSTIALPRSTTDMKPTTGCIVLQNGAIQVMYLKQSEGFSHWPFQIEARSTCGFPILDPTTSRFPTEIAYRVPHWLKVAMRFALESEFQCHCWADILKIKGEFGNDRNGFWTDSVKKKHTV